MGGAKKLHVGFPEKALDKYLAILVNNGFMVAVCEQTETPRMMEERIRLQRERENRSVPKEDKVVKRDIVEMVTRGTYQNKDTTQQGYEPKYVLAYLKTGADIGVTFFDISTSKIHLGEFREDNEECLQSFRTLISQIRPVEIIQ